ncbi:MAG: YfhO family protein, partial [Oscillospiraceae bacterium]|nr:YfhO family protein [Oscillospiraceae bacterium]
MERRLCQRREGSATGKRKRLGAAVYALAFAVPGLVMLWVCASLGMAPWGDKTILISDMSTQYVEFFCALKNGELFFSWSKALGTSYIGVFSYYVSSPLSLLTLFVPNEAMPIGLMFLMVLKIGLAGVSFAVFARKRFPGHDGAALICAVCYALMSYNAIYSICVMWLDGVIWLPLILLAVERILAGRSGGPLIAALTVCFISTWYISYMVGIFCALYLCARLAVLWPDRTALKTILLRFFGGAACALGLTAWLWLPTFLSMFTGKFSGGNVDYDGLLACDPAQLLNQLRPGQYRSITYGAPPYVFCGTAALVLAVVYFFPRKISPREKLASGALLAVSAASLLLSPADKVWHLFQRPNWFPARYSFVVSFCLLYLAVQALGPLLDWLGERDPWLKRGGALTLAALSVLELGFNTKTILGGLEGQFGSDSYRAYRDYYTANAQLVEAAKEDAGGGFYRMGARSDRGFNSTLSYGYPG